MNLEEEMVLAEKGGGSRGSSREKERDIEETQITHHTEL